MPGTSKNIQFVKQLADLENQDYQKAKVIYDAKEQEDQRLEDEDNEQRAKRLKVIQDENFQKLAKQHAQTQKSMRNDRIATESGFYASVRIPDMTHPKDPEIEKSKLRTTVNGFLTEQVRQKEQNKKDGDGKFFGMSDEEILLNKDVFA